MYKHMCVPATHRDQSRSSDLLELELQMVVNCYVDVGMETRPSARTSALNHWVISPAPKGMIF